MISEITPFSDRDPTAALHRRELVSSLRRSWSKGPVYDHVKDHKPMPPEDAREPRWAQRAISLRREHTRSGRPPVVARGRAWTKAETASCVCFPFKGTEFDKIIEHRLSVQGLARDPKVVPH
jgi:hypothetical protein